MKDNLVKCIATGLYSGYMKPYPGTWGTIPAWLIAYFLLRDNTTLLLIVAVVTLGISVWFSGQAEKEFGHDARKIVIDEWAGMFFAVLFMPPSLNVYILAFFAFRFWDVVKIPPAAQFERLPGGWGVTMDDIAAGIYANVSVRLVLYIAARFFDYSLV
jgi:phosphatidylglycerophosphatase A